MQREYGRLPLVCLCAGLVGRILNYAAALLMLRLAGGRVDTAQDLYLAVSLAISLTLIVTVGVAVRRLDRKTLLFSASLLVVYGILTLILEQAAQLFGFYNGFVSLLWLPVEIFQPVTSLLMRYCADLGRYGNLLYALPALFGPYLFALFGKSAKQQPSS